MQRSRCLLKYASVIALIAVVPQVSAGASSEVAKHWTADNGNGTYSNPLFYEEFEDPDVIRVGDTYYLAGTTMHINPAVQLMQSKDLVNWELAGYCTDRLDLGPNFRLEDGRGIYGQGIWAPCIRYHNGMFYVFTNVNGAGLQVFRSKSIKGPWERNQLPGRHDLSVLFDDDGKVYIISGANSPYPIEELAPDLKSFVPGVRHQLDAKMGEGHHLYKINGKYYDISAIPGATTDQMVARADSIDGPWTVERMVQGESLGVTTVAPARATPGDRGLTLHQGGIVDTPSGQWWSVIMSDHGSAGRMVALVPITWDNGFPIIGLPGNLRKAPNTWLKPNTGFTQDPKPAFIHDDAFDSGKLNPEWQWNHVPDDTKWSLTEKPGVLRLHSLPANDFYVARNSICQRPPAPESIMTVELDTSGMVAGDTAGLALLSSPYAWIGVVKTADGTTLQRYTSPNMGRGRRGVATVPPANPPTMGPINPPQRLWLRIHCNFDTDQGVFSWSADGKEFTPLGEPFTMTFQLTTFQGVRPSLFHYNTSGRPGGYADFDNYTVDEPRARGIEREIPVGKTIVLTSGADGSLLAADTQNDTLINVASDPNTPAPQNAKFQVVDLGLGRVALKAANGRFVSADGETVSLEDLAGEAPGDAESFQWINLMRGDTMLLSLTNHRYLATTPDTPGPVTATAAGPQPARKSGAEFKWKTVDPVTQAAGPAPVRADARKLPFATPLRWKSTGALVKPVSDANHTIVSVKDPTVVRYNDLWHIYATVYSTSARTWNMVYLNFKDWSDAPNAKLYFMDQNPNLRGYHCAPSLFYFRPHKKWYLVFQSQQPQYCTTDDLSKPETWTRPQNFFERHPASMPRLPIDYHVICDDTHAYLFFTGDNGCFYRSRTRIEDFPRGMSDPEIAIQDRRDNLFEASITYRIKSTNTYLTLIEALSPARYYRAWTSDRLDGAWTPVPNADTWQIPFAGINNVAFEDGVTPWTRDISHGEMIRDGYDETMILDPNNLQLLFQGRDPASGGRYELLPYQLGLLTLNRSDK